jgi:hypothetical protein
MHSRLPHGHLNIEAALDWPICPRARCLDHRGNSVPLTGSPSPYVTCLSGVRRLGSRAALRLELKVALKRCTSGRLSRACLEKARVDAMIC